MRRMQLNACHNNHYSLWLWLSLAFVPCSRPLCCRLSLLAEQWIHKFYYIKIQLIPFFHFIRLDQIISFGFGNDVLDKVKTDI